MLCSNAGNHRRITNAQSTLQKFTTQSAMVRVASRLPNRASGFARKSPVTPRRSARLSGRKAASTGVSRIGSKPPATKIASQPREVTNSRAAKPPTVLPTARPPLVKMTMRLA
jgi:hypothetical protein